MLPGVSNKTIVLRKAFNQRTRWKNLQVCVEFAKQVISYKAMIEAWLTQKKGCGISVEICCR